MKNGSSLHFVKIPIIYTRYCRHAWEISLKVDDSCCSKSVLLAAARTLRRLKKGPGWNGELLPGAGTWTKCRRLLKLKIRLRRATDIGTAAAAKLPKALRSSDEAMVSFLKLTLLKNTQKKGSNFTIRPAGPWLLHRLSDTWTKFLSRKSRFPCNYTGATAHDIDQDLHFSWVREAKLLPPTSAN